VEGAEHGGDEGALRRGVLGDGGVGRVGLFDQAVAGSAGVAQASTPRVAVTALATSWPMASVDRLLDVGLPGRSRHRGEHGGV
jgi:hypothetical protein